MPKTPPPIKQPTTKHVRKAREAAGLTQAQAAEVVYLAHSIRWSEYERGVHAMPLATWELFLFKTGQRELVIED